MDLARVKRSTAFLTHLATSTIIFIVLLVLILLYWFPGPLFAVDGGWQGIRLIAAVDLVLGPALTLMLFRPKRKKHRELATDLCIIATVQIIALVWGTWTVYDQRTVAISFFGKSFYSVSHGMLQAANEKLVTRDLQPNDPMSISTSIPPLVFVRPFDREEKARYMQELLGEGSMPEGQARSDRYQPLASGLDTLSRWEVDPTELAKRFPQAAAELERRLAQAEQEGQAFKAYRLAARFGRGVLLIDHAGDGRIVDIIPHS